MADRPISGLTQATSMTNADLFAISQGGQAKKVTWETFYSYLAEALDGHGGISSITYTPPASGSRTGTMTINYADGSSPTTVEVTDGKEITAITQYFAVSSSASTVPSTWHTTRQTLTAEDRYLWSYFEFAFNDPESLPIETPKTVIGVYGDKGEQGDTGDTGNGITSVDYVSTVDMVDTYRITFDNGTTTTFTVTNGSSIQSIDYDSTSGLTDTYIVTLTTGETSSFQVTNGKSITAIVPVDVTHTAGHTDVYRIDFNDGDTFTFSIYNGTNGTGAVSRVDGIDPDGTQDVPLLLLGQGAPTPTTVGLLKQRYFDQTNNVLYICTGIDTSGPDTTYIWQGAGVTVDSAFSSTSTNPVQNRIITGKVGTSSLNTSAQNLSDAINEHESDLTGKVDKVSGKGLSTNDFTNTYKNKIGTATLNTTAQDLSGAINEHETDLSGKVSKTGDIINGGALFLRNSAGESDHQGRLILNNPDITLGETHTKTVMGEIMFNDSNNGLYKTSVYGNLTQANTVQICLAARNWDGGGNAVVNRLTISTNTSGIATVAFSHPKAWLDGLTAATPTLETAVSNIVTAISGITINNAYYAQWGKVAQLRLRFTPSSALTGNTTVATLVAGKHPAENMWAPAQIRLQSGTTAYISSSGAIIVTGNFTAGNWYEVISTYILA